MTALQYFSKRFVAVSILSWIIFIAGIVNLATMDDVVEKIVMDKDHSACRYATSGDYAGNYICVSADEPQYYKKSNLVAPTIGMLLGLFLAFYTSLYCACSTCCTNCIKPEPGELGEPMMPGQVPFNQLP